MYTEYCAIHNSSLTLLFLLTANFSQQELSLFCQAFHLIPQSIYILPILNLVDGHFYHHLPILYHLLVKLVRKGYLSGEGSSNYLAFYQD